MRDIGTLHGTEFARTLVGLSEAAATRIVMDECPDWAHGRVLRYFAAAGLFGYTAQIVLGVTHVSKNGSPC
jgi:hypothetical protein